MISVLEVIVNNIKYFSNAGFYGFIKSEVNIFRALKFEYYMNISVQLK